MLSFTDIPASSNPGGVDPARVDYLLGDPRSWRFPGLVCLAAASVLPLLVAIAVLVGRVASGSATLALPFLSHQPCIVVLAAIPATLGVLGPTTVAASASARHPPPRHPPRCSTDDGGPSVRLSGRRLARRGRIRELSGSLGERTLNAGP